MHIFILDYNICNFVDDTTPYACDKNLDFGLERTDQESRLEDNYVKMNSSEFHLFVSGN